jgi:hypothetical protein
MRHVHGYYAIKDENKCRKAQVGGHLSCRDTKLDLSVFCHSSSYRTSPLCAARPHALVLLPGICDPRVPVAKKRGTSCHAKMKIYLKTEDWGNKAGEREEELWAAGSRISWDWQLACHATVPPSGITAVPRTCVKQSGFNFDQLYSWGRNKPCWKTRGIASRNSSSLLAYRRNITHASSSKFGRC